MKNIITIITTLAIILTAPVNAVVVHTYNNTCKTNINKNVTITCSKNGTIS